jgi:two-component system phosphate regulon sensor histidine kinase PhoR
LTEIENFSKDRLQITDLVSIAEHCKQFAMTAHKSPNISFYTDQTIVPVLGDPDLLDLAIVNLLENAIKYSKAPAQIKMSIQSIGSEVQLIVQDQGIGIPEADLPHIFERFYTVDKARSHKSGGTGLGLSIVKTIVEKHMGTVSASSQLGLGSTFAIHLNRFK